jgi:hypothetical protein
VIPVAYAGLAAGAGTDTGTGLEMTPASVSDGGVPLTHAVDAWRCRFRCFFFFLLATGD